MKQSFYILIVLCIGFLCNPNRSYACSKTVASEKTCCATPKCKTETKQPACSDHQKQKKSCSGNCDNNGCHVTTIFSSVLPNNYILKITYLLFLERATTFSYLEKSNSIPYFSVWSPPKIS